LCDISIYLCQIYKIAEIRPGKPSLSSGKRNETTMCPSCERDTDEDIFPYLTGQPFVASGTLALLNC
jgi:hypothetical protein